MARFELEIPENMLSGLSELFEDVADDMINAALPVYQEEIQRQLEKHRDTGELIESIQVKEARNTKNVAHMGVITAEGGSGKSSYTVKYHRKKDNKDVAKNVSFRNYQKLMALDHGVDGRQAPTPFLQSATKSAEPRIHQAMREVFEGRGQE